MLELMGVTNPKETPKADPLALISEQKERHSSQSFRSQSKKSEFEDEEAESDSDPEPEDIKSVVLFLSKAFKDKKFFKKSSSSSNRPRYSTTPNKRHDHKEKYEGKKKVEEGAKSEEKNEPIKCYNASWIISLDCKKVVKNSY